MVEAVTRILCRLPLLIALLALPSAALAHRDDQYLQATLVAIEPSGVRLQINLTPGVAVAEQVIAEIDRDRDGAISESEAVDYAEVLRRDLTPQNSAPVRGQSRWNSPQSPARSRPVPTGSRSRIGT
ncbi:MAG: hypothetical protein E6J73_19135 [Deltaproteobacteria bacterium]|nr:MAG: hypothetical protein E6J73_19135 [Deltaproteobacteria bacterium]